MAWERNFEKRVLNIREKELKFQRLNYIIEVRSLMMLKAIGRLSTSKRFSGMGSGEQSFAPCKLLPTWYARNASPMVVTLVAFFHFAVIKNQTLTPSVAFTSVRVTSIRCKSLTDENCVITVGRW